MRYSFLIALVLLMSVSLNSSAADIASADANDIAPQQQFNIVVTDVKPGPPAHKTTNAAATVLYAIVVAGLPAALALFLYSFIKKFVRVKLWFVIVSGIAVEAAILAVLYAAGQTFTANLIFYFNFIFIICAIVAAAFFALPVSVATSLYHIFKASGRVKLRFVILSVIVIETALLAVLAWEPIITYSDTIPQVTIEKNNRWVRSTLEKPFGGVYSYNIPFLAYRFHITELSDSSVEAEIHYLPFGGKRRVSYDKHGGYNSENIWR